MTVGPVGSRSLCLKEGTGRVMAGGASPTGTPNRGCRQSVYIRAIDAPNWVVRGADRWARRHTGGDFSARQRRGDRTWPRHG